ncbi:MAG: TlpA family protein disulfide reductase [Mucilaginibacter polytrichastri]|nr:TlpA family protein disulfide reductase [Mucilaginibacter polytrichastri]
MILFSFHTLSLAQFTVQTEGKKSNYQPKLNEKTIVKDASGKVVPYDVWKTKIRSGDFYIKSTFIPGTETTYVLLEATPEIKALYAQKKAELEKNNAALKAAADNDTTIVSMNDLSAGSLPVAPREPITDVFDEGLAAYPKPMESAVFKIGDKFKPFRARNLEGEVFNMKDLAGKVIVLNFWFINCPPCQLEMPELNKLFNRYKDNKDVVFFSVALDSESDLKNFLLKKWFEYPISAAGSTISGWYDIRQFPTNLVIGKDGAIRFHSVGYTPNTVYWLSKTITENL